MSDDEVGRLVARIEKYGVLIRQGETITFSLPSIGEFAIIIRVVGGDDRFSLVLGARSIAPLALVGCLGEILSHLKESGNASLR